VPTPRSRRGLKAEIAAAAELGRLGYKVVESNYRCRYGEIDLVATDGETLVFVEVRSRKSLEFGTPVESITNAKQEKLLLTAEHYLVNKAPPHQACRFDVVSVIFRENAKPEIEVIKDAFG